MLPPIDYLAWAQAHYPHVRLDLATSGLPVLSASELGAPAGALDDLSAWPRYREAVAAHFGVSMDEVAPALGASGGIFLTYASLLDHGDEVLIEQPTYEPVVRVAEGLGLAIRRLPRRPERGYQLSVDELEAHITPRTRALFITDLHNPSSAAADHQALAKIAARLDAQGAWLIVDEVYAELIQRGRTARPLAPNVVAFGSLTKCYGLSWPRVGYVLCPPKVRAQIERTILHTAGFYPSMMATLGAQAFGQIERLEARRLALQAGKRARIDAFLAKHEGVLSWQPPPEGALFGFVHDARGRDLRPLLEQGAKEHGVLAAAGSFFDYPSGFRLGWTLPAALLDEALDKLSLALSLG